MYYRKFWSKGHAHWVFLLWVAGTCVESQANMKPHPRVTRTKWADRLDAEPERSGKCSWHRDEKKKLLVALKGLSSRTAAGKTDIDCAFLRKHLPTRSLSEVRLSYRNDAFRWYLSQNKSFVNILFNLYKQKVRKYVFEWLFVCFNSPNF